MTDELQYFSPAPDRQTQPMLAHSIWCTAVSSGGLIMGRSTFDDIVGRRRSRRAVLRGATSLAAAGALTSAFGRGSGAEAAQSSMTVELPQPKVLKSAGGE